MMVDKVFHAIVSDLDLGRLTSPPVKVSGGYMHKMYKIETQEGAYAVKLLNPCVMKRPDALPNFQRAEQLEEVLYEHGLPVVPAIGINGRKMQFLNGQYYYVFHWVEARALRWNEIKAEHCGTAGALLAAIHKIERREKPCKREMLCADWDQYITQAVTECPKTAKELKAVRDLLYSGQEAYNLALQQLPPVTCICDGDMDSKNVLWQDGRPLIIDLECLDYGNPLSEMFQLALSWAGGTICHIDFGCLEAFLSSYRLKYGECCVSWEKLWGIGFSWLEWLEYNLKRALMIECADEEERKLGICEVHETIRRVTYYSSVKEELLECLHKL